jgi:hypothetical protein
MSSAKTHIQSIVGGIETLGYTFTDEFFDFDSFPTSGNDNIYRIEAKTSGVTGMAGSRVEKSKFFDLWFAFKLETSSDRKQDTYDVLDAKEAIEDKIFEVLAGVHVKIQENIMSAIKSDYILVKLTGEFIYWRDLTT